jgi:hypothetical protein
MRVKGMLGVGVAALVSTMRLPFTGVEYSKQSGACEERSSSGQSHGKRVNHLIARSEYGLMVQILSGLITDLLLAIYCHNHYQEKVSIKRVRELRIRIQNELRDSKQRTPIPSEFKEQERDVLNAKT